MKNLLQTEPARLTGLLVAAVTAVIALLVAFGVDLTDDQRNAILGVVAVVAPLLAGFVIRGQVYAPATVVSIAKRASDANGLAHEAGVTEEQLRRKRYRDGLEEAAESDDRRPGPDHLMGT